MAQIQIVDERDRPLRGGTKQEAWEKGLIHRIARILITDEQGRVLLQKRAPNVNPYPNRWDISAAGHVDEGETYLAAAKRELAEELGITNTELKEIDTYRTNKKFEWRQLNRFNKVFSATISAATPLQIQPEEVSEAHWFTKKEVEQLPSQDITDGLRHAIDHYF